MILSEIRLNGEIRLLQSLLPESYTAKIRTVFQQNKGGQKIFFLDILPLVFYLKSSVFATNLFRPSGAPSNHQPVYGGLKCMVLLHSTNIIAALRLENLRTLVILS